MSLCWVCFRCWFSLAACNVSSGVLVFYLCCVVEWSSWGMSIWSSKYPMYLWGVEENLSVAQRNTWTYGHESNWARWFLFGKGCSRTPAKLGRTAGKPAFHLWQRQWWLHLFPHSLVWLANWQEGEVSGAMVLVKLNTFVVGGMFLALDVHFFPQVGESFVITYQLYCFPHFCDRIPDQSC